jgi:hypothetical protein
LIAYSLPFWKVCKLYIFSMFVNNHTCALVLLFGTNCPYECRNNCQMFAIRHVIFYFYSIYFFLGWNYLCLGIEPLFELSIFTAVDKVKDVYCITRCEKIIEHTVVRQGRRLAASLWYGWSSWFFCRSLPELWLF